MAGSSGSVGQLHDHARNEAVPESPPPASPEPAANPLTAILSGLLKWSAALITFGGLALHVAGYIYHAEYAQAFGLDADLFPKSVEWVLIQGYMVLANSIAGLVLRILEHWAAIALWFLFAGGTIALCVFMIRKTDQRNIAPDAMWMRIPEWLRIVLLSYLYVGSVSIALVLAPMFALVFLFFPAQLAIDLAKEDYASKQKTYTLGCEHKEQTARCITVMREGKPELQGFLIDSSDKLLALYLPASNQVQVIEREKVEMSAGLSKGKT